MRAAATVAGPSPRRRRRSAAATSLPSIGIGGGEGQPGRVPSATRKRSSVGTRPLRLSAAQVCASTAANPQPGPERAFSAAAPLSKATTTSPGCNSRRWSSIRRSRPLTAAVSPRRQTRRRSPCCATMGPSSCDRLPKLARSSHLQRQPQLPPLHHQHPRQGRRH